MRTTSTVSLSPRNRVPFSGPRAPSDARAITWTLRSLGIDPSRRLGQSFLADPFVADAEAALAGSSAPAPIVEIGGGLGILTEALLRRGLGPVTVLERDRRLADHLRRVFGEEVRVEAVDALEYPFDRKAVVVGNLPFSVATPILLRLFELRVPKIVALVQREVAERLGAVPGNKEYGRLTVIAALYGRVDLYQTVPSTSFEPSPAVAGRVVTHVPRPGKLPVPSAQGLERLLKQLFSHRRKKLANLLPSALPSGFDPIQTAGEAEWPSNWQGLRPESISPSAYFRLAKVLARRETELSPRLQLS